MRTAVGIALGFALPVAGASACNQGAAADLGADAYMRLPGAQFVRGPMPEGSPKGPAVEAIRLVDDDIWAGLSDDPIGGALAPSATAAAIGLQGDLGYWLVPAGIPDVATPDEPSFSATATFSRGIVLGSYTLVVRAVDDAGAFGPPSTQILVAEPLPTDPPATGALVVTLTWDTESNLSLHVVDPAGAEIYWNDPSSQPPFHKADAGSYGYIDYDSNANCVIDGLRREDVIWPAAPPPGKYTVRVDAPSLCGQPIANWSVRATLYGKRIGQASGVALDADTRGSHGSGAGVLALELTVP
jgi:hypothetical protein